MPLSPPTFWSNAPKLIQKHHNNMTSSIWSIIPDTVPFLASSFWNLLQTAVLWAPSPTPSLCERLVDSMGHAHVRWSEHWEHHISACCGEQSPGIIPPFTRTAKFVLTRDPAISSAVHPWGMTEIAAWAWGVEDFCGCRLSGEEGTAWGCLVHGERTMQVKAMTTPGLHIQQDHMPCLALASRKDERSSKDALCSHKTMPPSRRWATQESLEKTDAWIQTAIGSALAIRSWVLVNSENNFGCQARSSAHTCFTVRMHTVQKTATSSTCILALSCVCGFARPSGRTQGWAQEHRKASSYLHD